MARCVGVPLSALAPNAPEEYLVRRGDTLWGIAGVFLRSPWRWPELWGMNLGDIRNPHLIYPGQRLFLERVGDRALLRTHQAGAAPALETVRVSPRTRAEVLREYGRPARTMGVHSFDGDIWVWRYLDGPTWRLLFIDIDRAGVVRGWSNGDEDLPDPPDPPDGR